MKKQLVLAILAVAMSLTACGNKSTVDYYNNTFTAPQISVDNSTVRHSDVNNTTSSSESNSDNSESTEENNTGATTNNSQAYFSNDLNHDPEIAKQKELERQLFGENYSAAISEITIENVDNSVNYEIVGNDIIYDGVTFHDLFPAVTAVKAPCDTNTFINFLVKCFDPMGLKDVYASYERDEDLVAEGEDVGAPMTTSETASELKGYQEIRDKYGADVTWSLGLRTQDNSNSVSIYGCESYLTYQSMKPLTVDMSQFDTSEFDKTDTPETEETQGTEETDGDAESGIMPR